ncbi:hypothetical protein HK104_001292 [Borealophlyctis nickersoniae]|nr:hypothetical protein HK104_001292 [Borealophlyctis nickersoniae]
MRGKARITTSNEEPSLVDKEFNNAALADILQSTRTDELDMRTSRRTTAAWGMRAGAVNGETGALFRRATTWNRRPNMENAEPEPPRRWNDAGISKENNSDNGSATCATGRIIGDLNGNDVRRGTIAWGADTVQQRILAQDKNAVVPPSRPYEPDPAAKRVSVYGGPMRVPKNRSLPTPLSDMNLHQDQDKPNDRPFTKLEKGMEEYFARQNAPKTPSATTPAYRRARQLANALIEINSPRRVPKTPSGHENSFLRRLQAESVRRDGDMGSGTQSTEGGSDEKPPARLLRTDSSTEPFAYGSLVPPYAAPLKRGLLPDPMEVLRGVENPPRRNLIPEVPLDYSAYRNDAPTSKAFRSSQSRQSVAKIPLPGSEGGVVLPVSVALHELLNIGRNIALPPSPVSDASSVDKEEGISEDRAMLLELTEVEDNRWLGGSKGGRPMPLSSSQSLHKVPGRRSSITRQVEHYRSKEEALLKALNSMDDDDDDDSGSEHGMYDDE